MAQTLAVSPNGRHDPRPQHLWPSHTVRNTGKQRGGMTKKTTPPTDWNEMDLFAALWYNFPKETERQIGILQRSVIVWKSQKSFYLLITVLFAVLGLVKILPFDMANPIMLVSLATLLLLRSVEYKNNRDKSGFIMTCLTAVFVYVVVICNVFIG